MNASPSFPIFTLFSMLAVSGLVGCLVGLFTAALVAGKTVRKHLPDFEEFIAIRQINITSNVTVDDDGSNNSLELSSTGREITSRTVELWLDKRGLMMAPKGRDFTVERKEHQ